MRRSHALIAALFAAVIANVGAAKAAVVISIDKSAQRMTVTVDGVTRYNWPVSTGRAGYDTPSGSYRAFRMEEDHYSKEWDDAPMPHSIFFTTEGHAIHGSFARIGSPASHGCVRLAPANAATLFALVKDEGVANTKVVLSGTAPTATARKAPRVRPSDDEAAYAPRPPYYGEPRYPRYPQAYAAPRGYPYYAPQTYYGQQPYYGQQQYYYPPRRGLFD